MPDEMSGAKAQDVQTAYINDLRRVPRLSNTEHKRLREAMLAGSQHARDTLWIQALRIVLRLEGRLRQRYDIESTDLDMLQEGNLAAGRALESWDPERGAFSTWIHSNARGAMLDYLNEANKGGVGSKSSAAQIVDMDEGVAYAPETTGTTDTPGAKQEAAITRGELLTYEGIMVGTDREGTSAYVPQGFETAETMADIRRLCAALDSLPEADSFALRAYYGIGMPSMTLEQLAKHTGYSVSGIRKRITLSKVKVQEALQHSILRVRAPD